MERNMDRGVRVCTCETSDQCARTDCQQYPTKAEAFEGTTLCGCGDSDTCIMTATPSSTEKQCCGGSCESECSPEKDKAAAVLPNGETASSVCDAYDLGRKQMYRDITDMMYSKSDTHQSHANLYRGVAEELTVNEHRNLNPDGDS